MKNLLSKRTLILFAFALVAIIALVVSLLIEKKQLIDIYEGSDESPEDLPEDPELTKPTEKRKPGRPAKVVNIESATVIEATPAEEKPANIVKNETSE